MRPGLWGGGAWGWCLGSYRAIPTRKASGLGTFEDFRKFRSGHREQEIMLEHPLRDDKCWFSPCLLRLLQMTPKVGCPIPISQMRQVRLRVGQGLSQHGNKVRWEVRGMSPRR